MAQALDKIDLQILTILQQNGRTTNLQLSEEVHLSPASTLERVRKLEYMGYIKSYHALVDEELLGLIGIKAFVQVQLDFRENDAIQTFLEEINKLKEITECHHVTGACDFMLKVYVKDLKSYEQLIVHHLSKMSVIKNIQTTIILSTTKKQPAIPLAY